VKSHTPTADEKKWMNDIVQLGCIVCWREFDLYTEPEVHHIAGKTKPGSHLLTIPLCTKHHRSGENNPAWVSRHPWKNEFIGRYGSELDLLAATKEATKKQRQGKSYV